MLSLLRTSLRTRAVASPAWARSLATVAPKSLNPFNPDLEASLHLKSGESFVGRSFGHPKSRFGEAVFSTSITSYTESMTDPSYRSQFLVFTTPLVGNYGVPGNLDPANHEPNGPPVMLESNGVQCAGVIVADVAERYSHYQAVESLHEWCDRHGVPGITGVDTRAITTLLRTNGSTLAQIAVGDGHAQRPHDADYWDPAVENLVDQVSTREVYTLNPDGDVKIALLDFGAKANILRSLTRRGASVTVFPWNFDFNKVRDQFDGLFLSNGPGDPKHCMDAAVTLRKTIDEWDKPIFGICMGHQIIGLAAGLDAYRMRFGNRGHNQPVLALASSGNIKAGRVYVTSQNHQCVVAPSLARALSLSPAPSLTSLSLLVQVRARAPGPVPSRLPALLPQRQRRCVTHSPSCSPRCRRVADETIERARSFGRGRHVDPGVGQARLGRPVPPRECRRCVSFSVCTSSSR